MKKCTVVFFVWVFVLAFADVVEPDATTDSHEKVQIHLDVNLTPDNSATEPVWKHLECMDQETRENSEIYLILEPNATQEAMVMARTIESMWNAGEFEDALARFPGLGNLTDINEMAIGNAWRIPIPTHETVDWGNDVRVGNRDSIYICVLDRHTATNNLFAIVMYEEGSGCQWAANFSSDGGTTWTETGVMWATYELKSLDAVSVADHCYVAFGGGASQYQALINRFNASDGTPDTFPNGYYTVLVFTTTSPDSIREVTLWSNQDGYNHRLYYGALINSGEIRTLWADPDALSWTDFVSNFTNAERGLDACSNDGIPASHYLWLSYISTNDSLCVCTYEASVWLQMMKIAVGSAYPRYTALGAYCDTIIVLYEYDPPYGLSHIRYGTSFDGGNSWVQGGTIGDVDTTHESPAVTARLGGGQAVVYRYYTLPRELRFSWRDYTGSWSTPVIATETEPYYNQPSIQYLDGNVHGVLFLSWHIPYERAAYFTRSDWTGMTEHKPSAVSNQFISLTPNPSKKGARLSYVLARDGHVNISIYDALGRLIDEPVNEMKPAGAHSISIESKNLTAGIYFIHAVTPDGNGTKTMTIVE